MQIKSDFHLKKKKNVLQPPALSRLFSRVFQPPVRIDVSITCSHKATRNIVECIPAFLVIFADFNGIPFRRNCRAEMMERAIAVWISVYTWQQERGFFRIIFCNSDFAAELSDWPTVLLRRGCCVHACIAGRATITQMYIFDDSPPQGLPSRGPLYNV